MVVQAFSILSSSPLTMKAVQAIWVKLLLAREVAREPTFVHGLSHKGDVCSSRGFLPQGDVQFDRWFQMVKWDHELWRCEDV